ncbi:MAG: DUF2992 family protein [Ruminococcus sp.]|nr:DUF2992 family protein [Ruminococcus sp.]
MKNMEGKLTVFFDDPFWVGVFEHCNNGRLSVCNAATLTLSYIDLKYSGAIVGAMATFAAIQEGYMISPKHR